MSKHIGVVGDKLEATVTIKALFESVDYTFSYYGTTKRMYIMEDVEGNVIIWRTTASMNVSEDGTIYHMKDGDTVCIAGKIKAHTEYKGTNQTEITRCKYKLIQRGISEEEKQEIKRKEQMDSIGEKDFVWEKMPYKQYKQHYADCETIVGSFSKGRSGAVIDVIIRYGRLKNSGVRGQNFSTFVFESDEGKCAAYRAVCLANAEKQHIKSNPVGSVWKVKRII